MSIKYIYSSTTYSLTELNLDSLDEHITALKNAPARLVCKKGDYTCGVAAVPSKSKTLIYTGDDWRYYCTPPSHTIAFRKNNTTYYCGDLSRETKVSYDIPAGTYSPSAFETLIKKYISVNSYRTCSNAFTVTVNNQTVSVSANTKIYYSNNASSGLSSIARVVSFSGGTGTFNVGQANATSGFSTYKMYTVNGGSIPYFGQYANYNITVTTGINFS